MLQSVQGGSNLPQKNQQMPKFKVSKDTTDDAKFSATHYSSDKVTLSYKNLSGEELTVEVERTQFSSVNLSKYSEEDKAKWQEIVKSIREEFAEMQAKSIRDILKGHTAGKKDEPKKVEISADELEKKTDELIEKMPEYWRPEQVSDRILEFATAFFGHTESQGEDFYELAKSAIEEGFKMAGDDLGQLPGDIENVIARTRELVMEKLDRWAEEQGILPQEEEGASGIDISA